MGNTERSQFVKNEAAVWDDLVCAGVVKCSESIKPVSMFDLGEHC